MSVEIVVRDAVPEDAEGIARVHVRTWQAAYTHIFTAERLGGLSATLQARADFWRRAIGARQSRSHTLVAQAADGLVGFASVGQARDEDLDAGQVGELYAIYVLPEASGKGAGRALMAELLQRLRQERFREATLWVLEDNPRTRVFYELAGWTADGTTKMDAFFGMPVREVRYRIGLGD